MVMKGNRRKDLFRQASLLLALIILLAFATAAAAWTAAGSYRVVRSFPHDRGAFTQGLTFADGFFYEGTGLYGRSRLRKVEVATGSVLKEAALKPEYFGEGVAVIGKRIFQVTWRSQVGFVYDRRTFRLLKTIKYRGEGWGLTYDGRHLVMSDGTPRLRFFDPESFQERSSLTVFDGQGPVEGINELEYVKDEIYANIWPTDVIAVIDPATGRVKKRLILSGLLDRAEAGRTDVPNGIAYDAASGRLFVTGKWWPKVFEIAVDP